MAPLGAQGRGAALAQSSKPSGSPAVPRPAPPRPLTPREKAAVIVRFLLSEGAVLPLAKLPDHMQAALTEQIGQMRLVDRTTLAQVVEEFLNELEQVGLAFPVASKGPCR